MKKRMLSILLAVALLLSCAPMITLTAQADDSGTCGTNVTWSYDAENGVLTIGGTGTTMTDYASSGAAPWYQYRDNIYSIVIGDNVTRIGKYSFYNLYRVTNVTMPSALANIQGYAFYGCVRLRTVDFPSTLNVLSQAAFGCAANAQVSALTVTFNSVPGTISTGSPGVFGNRTYTLRVPTNWTDAKTTALNGTVEKTVYHGACGANATWEVDGTTLTIEGTGAMPNYTLTTSSDTVNYPWAAWKDTITDVVVGEGITAIGHYAFYRMTAVENVSLASTVARLETRPFKGCSSLTEITLPAAMTYVGLQAFVETALESLTLRGTLLTTSGTHFSGTAPCTGLTFTLYISCGDDVANWNSTMLAKWGGTVTEVSVAEHDYDADGVCAVCGDHLATSSIELDIESATYYLNSEPTLTATVTPSNAYDRTVTWTSSDEDVITVDDGVLTILSAGTTTITAEAGGFSDSADITVLNSYGGHCGTGANVGGIESLTWVLPVGSNTLTISGNGATGNYESKDPYWLPYEAQIENVVVGEGVTQLSNYAFKNMTHITSVTLPSTLTSLQKGAFYGCSGLTSLTLPVGFTTLGHSALQGTSITDLYLKGATITTFGGQSAGNHPCENLSLTLHIPCTAEDWSSSDLDKFGAASITVQKDIHADGYTADNCPLCGGTVDPIDEDAVAQMMEIAQTYIDNRASMVYGNYFTPFNSDTTNQIDCSSFVHLVLYGIPYENSRYVGGQNIASMNFGVTLPDNNDSIYSPNRYLANELAKYGEENCYVVYDRDSEDKTDLTAIRPGDVLFFDNEENLTFYRSITHTAICTDAMVNGTIGMVHGNDVTIAGKDMPNIISGPWAPSLVLVIRFPVTKSTGADVLTSSITLNYSNMALTLSDTPTLVVSQMPTDVKNTRIVWSTSDATVATVEAGKITPRKAGTATITATAADGSGVSASCNVTVTATASGSCGANANYTFADGVLTISGTGALTDITYNSSLDSIRNSPWDAWRDLIHEVVVGSGITAIGTYEFYRLSALASITLPTSITIIKARAFYGCSSLTGITVPAAVTTIGMEAFKDSGIETLAFNGVPTTISTTGDGVCDGLTYVLYVPTAWTAEKTTALGGTVTATYYGGICGNSAAWTLVDGVLTITGTGTTYNYETNDRPWDDAAEDVTSVVIGEGITGIGNFTLKNLANATSVELPSTLARIEKGAFYGMSSLTSVTLPANVTFIGHTAFNGTGLTTIRLQGTLLTTSGTHFGGQSAGNYPCEGLTFALILSCGDDLEDWDSTMQAKFGGTITDVSLAPHDYDELGVCEECGAYLLADTVTLNEEAATVGLNGSLTLTATVLPANAHDKSVTWTSTDPSVATVADGVLAILSAGTTTITATAADGSGASASCVVTVTNDRSGTCGENATWTLSDGVLTISGTGDMEDYNAIGDAPWYDYRADITSIVVESGITAVGKYAFTNCTAATGVALPESLQKIQLRSFQGCTSLTELTVPADVVTLGQEALKNSGITSLTFLGGAPTTISTGGSRVCGGLTYQLHLPYGDETWTAAKISALGGTPTEGRYGTFGEGFTWDVCGTLLTITGTGEMPTFSLTADVPNYPWVDWQTTITSAVVGEGITKINHYAFYKMTALSDVSLPSTLARIETRVFKGCTALKELTLPASIAYLGYEAFVNSGLKTLTVLGDAPTFSGTKPCTGLVYTIVTPADNTTWTTAKKNDIGGEVSVASTVGNESDLITASANATVEKIYLNADVTLTEDLTTTKSIHLSKTAEGVGCTMDLAGHALTCGEFTTSFGYIKDNATDSNDGTPGILSADSISWVNTERNLNITGMDVKTDSRVINAYQPIYDSAAGGYRFFRIDNNVRTAAKIDSLSGKLIFRFIFNFSNGAAWDLIQNGDSQTNFWMIVKYSSDLTDSEAEGELCRYYLSAELLHTYAVKQSETVGQSGQYPLILTIDINRQIENEDTHEMEYMFDTLYDKAIWVDAYLGSIIDAQFAYENRGKEQFKPMYLIHGAAGAEVVSSIS